MEEDVKSILSMLNSVPVILDNAIYKAASQLLYSVLQLRGLTGRSSLKSIYSTLHQSTFAVKHLPSVFVVEILYACAAGGLLISAT